MDVARLLDKYECDIMVAPMWTEATTSLGGNPLIAVPMPAHPIDWPLPVKIKYERVSTGPNIPYVYAIPPLFQCAPVDTLLAQSIMFIGRRFDDGLVISAAYSFEQATHHGDKFRPILNPAPT